MAFVPFATEPLSLLGFSKQTAEGAEKGHRRSTLASRRARDGGLSHPRLGRTGLPSAVHTHVGGTGERRGGRQRTEH